jgi:predicted transposase YbfD/YdcC
MNYTIPAEDGISFEVNSLYEAFRQLHDRRKARGKRYELAVILTLSVLAKFGGEDEPEGIAEWVKLRGGALREALGIKRMAMPHAVTYRRVLGEAVDIAEFEQVMSTFFQRLGGDSQQVAIDGKRLRGTIEAGQTRGVYLLAVYAPECGLVLNQVNIEDKANEISAAPAVLSGLELRGKVVTGDALFTQRELSAMIVEAGGDYAWLVKDNQPTLRADIERLFGPERPPPHRSKPIFNQRRPPPKPMAGLKHARLPPLPCSIQRPIGRTWAKSFNSCAMFGRSRQVKRPMKSCMASPVSAPPVLRHAIC